MTPEITVKQLQEELASDHPPIVVDVREAEELEISRLSAYVHIPMMELPNRLSELDKEAAYVILCRSGSRSARVTVYMLQSGFKHVRNVAGGINRWASEIDSRVAQY
ncbi:MAG TPA: rhodanese-like domain-containing protein [Fimbriimonadaceae bacterium]|nr:rhodanese-like domain-containing protein [Fimbriimonadaceae bacterium]